MHSCRSVHVVDAGACVHMAVHEPADHLLLTVNPLVSSGKTKARIKHTITLLNPANGMSSLSLSLPLTYKLVFSRCTAATASIAAAAALAAALAAAAAAAVTMLLGAVL